MHFFGTCMHACVCSSSISLTSSNRCLLTNVNVNIILWESLGPAYDSIDSHHLKLESLEIDVELHISMQRTCTLGRFGGGGEGKQRPYRTAVCLISQ